MPQAIGFVGLGAMGLPMLENLASSAASPLVAYDTSDAPFRHLAALPGWGETLSRAATLADFGPCGVVILMLPNSAITNAVVLGAEGAPGLIDVLSCGATIIDMGSSDPIETRRLAQLLAERGIELADAPVSGAVSRARTGDLAIMVGGDDTVLDRLRPLLETMGSTLIPVGRTGDAHAIKALNNYVYAAGLLAVSEALCIAETQGLDLEKLADVLNVSSGRNVASETKVKQAILPGTYDAGFLLRLQAKDLRIARALAQDARVDADQLSLCAKLWSDVAAAMPDADNTEIHRFLKTRTVRQGDTV